MSSEGKSEITEMEKLLNSKERPKGASNEVGNANGGKENGGSIESDSLSSVIEKSKETKEEEKTKEAGTDEKKNDAKLEKSGEAEKTEKKIAVKTEEKSNEAEITEKKIEVKTEEKSGEAETTEKKSEVETEEKSDETEAMEKKIEEKAVEEKSDTETEKENKAGETDDVNTGGSSMEEEQPCVFNLKEFEKKALFEMRSKVEEAILGNKLFNQRSQASKEESESQKEDRGKEAEQSADPEKQGQSESENKPNPETSNKERNENSAKESDHIHKLVSQETVKDDINDESHKDISLWGVPLLPSKGHDATDTVLLKFLRARDFRANEALEMLKNTLHWRKQNKIDTILKEDFGDEFNSAAIMVGNDREGQPVCYNVYGVFGDEKMLEKLMGTEEKRQRFLRWRVQLMEKGIQKLDMKPGGTTCLLQISDLSNTPLPSRKEVRSAIKQAASVLQDNYPEFVARNVFINVPFWYYAFATIISPSLTQRTKSKFVYARPAKAHETLLKYVAGEQIPPQFGGLKRDNDQDFSDEDTATEVVIKSGYTETIEISAPEAGKTMMWDVCVAGGEVSYKEEFIPTDENSYTVIVKRERRIGLQEGSMQNSFKINEPGKITIVVHNGSFKKKRLLYRYKTV